MTTQPRQSSEPRRPVRTSQRRGLSPLGVALLALLVLVGVVLVASKVWTEVLWFDQMGAIRVLLTRWGATAGMFLIGFLVVFGMTAFVMRGAWKDRQPAERGEAGAAMRAYRAALEPVRPFLMWGVPALLGLTNGVSFASNWQVVLTFVQRTSFGEADPQFGLDISFFVFVLPFLDLVVGLLLGAVALSLLIAVVVHYLYGSLRPLPGPSGSPGATRSARARIGVLAAVASALIGVRYWLGRYDLLTQQGDPVDGAMYSDVHAVLPASSILAVISVLVAVLFLVAAVRGSWRLPVVGVVVTVASALVIGWAYPALVQQFRVTPNARQLESEYIQRNIDATLAAYGLDDLEYQTYAAKTDARPGQLREDSETTSQIRLLDPEVITPTVKQLQQSRPYYGFNSGMYVDRYTVDGQRRDTVIAMRELDLAGLSTEQRTWVNLHTVYTHGFGVVAAYGNTVTGDGLPAYWEQSIPSVGEMGDYEPRIYFSPSSPEYSIVGAPEGAEPQELDYPDDNAPGGQVSTTFTGNGGPSVGNLWNKLLYSVKFGSTDIFFSSQTNEASQILYDRDPLTRVAKVAPYLTLEQSAYPAVVDMDGDPATPRRLVWIVDAYTTSDEYPYAQHQALDQSTVDSRQTTAGEYIQANTVNYIRNSVKAVVDAYDGSVRLFRWDEKDPVLATWMKIYPGMIEPLSSISGDLMSHLRYPEDLFKVQRELLTSYHVTEASEFYTGGDRWRLAQDTSTVNRSGDLGQGERASAPMVQPPYYLTMQMPGQASAEFSLTSVFVPGGESRREAMAGFLAVDSETGSEAGKVREGYGKLRLIALPSSTTVPGPGQVQNKYDSNEMIASQLNLLNLADSNVIRGNLLTLPVGGGLLYVQPVYVQGTGSASYPVLRSVLTAFGDQVGFAPTLQESLDQTFGGDSAATVASGDQGDDHPQSGDATAPLTSERKLDAALRRAAQAMKDADAAMKAGDWTAYGEAQKRLDSALSEALAAQDLDAPGAEGAQSGAAGGAVPTPAASE